MKIAILGGAYDPPHLGHIIVAEQVLEIMKGGERIMTVKEWSRC